MKINKLILALIAVAFAVNTYAAPPPKPPEDVNVVNTPSVTVTNPQTSVTVNNGAGNPVPVTGSVTVDNASPIPVNIQNQTTGCVQYQFVGFTTSTYNGGQGILTYTNTCDQEFPGGRMCTYGEFYATSPFPTVDANTVAWIWPWDNKTSRGFISNDCSAWISTLASEQGAVIRGDGAATTEPCTSTLPIACCAPAQ